MTANVHSLPLLALLGGCHRFTVSEYEQLTRLGVLTENSNVELLEGILVRKMSGNPPHDGTLWALSELLRESLPSGWILRLQMALSLSDSVPEPDVAIVTRDTEKYTRRHPGAADVALVVEVADSTLEGDRQDKCRIYARAALPEYWIVNLVDRCIEVYTQPSGMAANPAYSNRRDFDETAVLPWLLGEQLIANLAVRDILPPVDPPQTA